MIFWYLLQGLPENPQASLGFCAFLQDPSLFTHRKCYIRPGIIFVRDLETFANFFANLLNGSENLIVKCNFTIMILTENS